MLQFCSIQTRRDKQLHQNIMGDTGLCSGTQDLCDCRRCISITEPPWDMWTPGALERERESVDKTTEKINKINHRWQGLLFQFPEVCQHSTRKPAPHDCTELRACLDKSQLDHFGFFTAPENPPGLHLTPRITDAIQGNSKGQQKHPKNVSLDGYTVGWANQPYSLSHLLCRV